MTPGQARKLIKRTQTALNRAYRKLARIEDELDAWQDDRPEDDSFDLVVKMEHVRGQIERADEAAAQADWVD
ncbi:MAG: hypothetical protein KJO40_13410 [Deltaproteobacteria bacterium]|nr:hypothetical protein [Deltaproteobacteria bacterium]